VLYTRTSTYRNEVNFFASTLQNQKSPSKKCANAYTYGFNGKEKDDEIKGGGASYDYGFRIYDPRLGRFLSVDPLTRKYAMLTPYQFASNMPIAAIDLDGLEARITINSSWFLKQIQKATDAGDIQEAERLTWAAVHASLDDGSPAASFVPDENGLKGFTVLNSKELFSFNVGDDFYYNTAKIPWATGQKDLSVSKNEFKKEYVKILKNAIVEIDKDIDGWKKEITKVESDFEIHKESMEAGQEGEGGQGGAGVTFNIIAERMRANIKINKVQKKIDAHQAVKNKVEEEINNVDSKIDVIDEPLDRNTSERPIVD